MSDRHFYTLTIAKLLQRTEHASSIELSVPCELKNLFTFKAGQYLTFKTQLNGEELRRSYSINSASVGNEALQVTVKKVKDGKVSNHFVDNLVVGDEIDVMPPLGQFVLSDQPSGKTFFYAAGSGITPVYGLIKTLLKTNDSAKVNLQYGNYERSQVIFFDEFENLQQEYQARFELQHHYTNAKKTESGKGLFAKMFSKKTASEEQYYEAGDFTASKLKEFSKTQENFIKSDHYICGPGQMIPELENALLNLGVAQNNIHHEYFSAAADATTQTKTASTVSTSGSAKLTVTLDGDTEIFDLPAGETVLRASIEQGLSVPYACESGVCSTCKAKCLSGAVRMRSNSVLSDSEIAEGYILTCQAEAVSSEVVVDYDQV